MHLNRLSIQKFLVIIAVVFAATSGCGNKGNDGTEHTLLPAVLTDLQSEQQPMPPFPPEYGPEFWINAPAGFPKQLAGKVVLVDFWDYTCINCIRTFPYLSEWHSRYKNQGLAMIGVHAPEFGFGKDPDNVKAAVKRFGLAYPIVMDNAYRLWDAYGNRFWPATYLFDKNGILRYYHVGEGNYAQTEEMIQKLLKEQNGTFTPPTVMAPVRPEDEPGAACTRPTPETYLGYERGTIANGSGYVMNASHAYEAAEDPAEDSVMLAGNWEATEQCIIPQESGGKPPEIVLSYTGGEVNLVMKPIGGKTAAIMVEQDGRPVDDEIRGTDLKTDGEGNTVVRVDEARMYNLVRNSSSGRHRLVVRSIDAPFEAYVFTFTALCER